MVCRRVLAAPIVEKDTYCRELTKDGKLVGEGERNAKGEEEGFGTMVFASGNVYVGEWKANQKEGRGTYRFADGNVYEGEYKADKPEGRGTCRYVDGDVYEPVSLVNGKGRGLRCRAVYQHPVAAVCELELDQFGIFPVVDFAAGKGCHDGGDRAAKLGFFKS